MGQVTLERSEYDELREKILGAERRAAELEKEVERLRARAVDEISGSMASALRNARVLVDFAVANLDPEFIRDWPWQELESLSAYLNDHGGEPRDGERVLVWADHIRRVIKFETDRQLRGTAAAKVLADKQAELDALDSKLDESLTSDPAVS